ncbi:MAG: YfcE family phosphodiesterase [Pirellulales bacterium]|nr:YfcE family phosphodiesterase [Pirellulales bacterium]
MLVGVLSDTHGDVHAARPAVRLFASLGVARLLHCGDVGSAEILRMLAPWPTHFVLGNVDRQAMLNEAIAQAGHTCHGRFGSIEWEGRRIALLHGDDAKRLDETIRSGKWDLVCHGHTHAAALRQCGPTTVLNPGAIARTDQSSIALVELPSLRVTPIAL